MLLLIEIVFFHAAIIPVLPDSLGRKKDCRFSELLAAKSQMNLRRVKGPGNFRGIKGITRRRVAG
jgi:hypothetical protein